MIIYTMFMLSFKPYIFASIVHNLLSVMLPRPRQHRTGSLRAIPSASKLITMKP